MSRQFSKDDFNRIVGRKIREKNDDLPEGYDVLSTGGHLYYIFGLDSLDVMEIVLEIEETFGIKVDNKKLTNIKTVTDLWYAVNK